MWLIYCKALSNRRLSFFSHFLLRAYVTCDGYQNRRYHYNHILRIILKKIRVKLDFWPLFLFFLFRIIYWTPIWTLSLFSRLSQDKPWKTLKAKSFNHIMLHKNIKFSQIGRIWSSSLASPLKSNKLSFHT